MTSALAMLIALGLDACVGWPDSLYRCIGHPVSWLGRVITTCEHRLNTAQATDRYRFWAGACLSLGLVGLVSGLGMIVEHLLPDGWAGVVLVGILAWPLVAARSMYTHVAAVLSPMLAGDLTGARRAVSMIVGRDPDQLDQAGICRASLESLAENSSDGIVAPLFWGAVLGLPGIMAYKVINTLDSMIGHRNDRFEQFGKFAARLDDVVNLVPARLTGVLFAFVSAHPWAALSCMMREAGFHRSPNAGWPETSLAAALKVRLSGPRAYGDGLSDEPWVNGAASDPSPDDLKRGLQLYLRAMVALAACLAGVAFLMG